MSHEKFIVQIESVQIWYSRQLNNVLTFDNTIKIKIKKKENYWVKLICRLIVTISFLSIKSLEFRRDNQMISSKHNGNYLGCLISKFHSFLASHINKYSNKNH